MQRCQKCGRTYENDTQKFCTHDGGRLVFEQAPASSQAPTAYDLNLHNDPFDPEATVTRMPDLNKTVTSAPTSEIRIKETGPAMPPGSSPYQQPPEPPPPPPPASSPTPTVAYNPPPPQQHYQQPVALPQMQQQAPPYAPGQGQPAQPPQSAAAVRKSSRLPMIIGLVVVVLLGGAAAWYFLIYKKSSGVANANSNITNANANTGRNANENATANANTTSTPPILPPANATQFVNSSANLDGKLAEEYSDFSFYYPNTWEVDPKSGVAGAPNFVQVERRLPPDFTQENFAVSWYKSKGTYATDSDGLFKEAVALARGKYAKSLPEFEVVSEGETSVNGIKGYEFRFQGIAKGTEKGDVTFWGRVIFLPPGKEGETNGTQLLMLTTSLAPELQSADDVGVKGELPVILNSFKLGSNK